MSHMTADPATNARHALQHEKEEAALVTVSKQLARQEHRLDRLEMRVQDLVQRRQGGGFPWLLVLVVGGIYALSRNPSVRDQIKQLLNQADPGVKGNLERAGEAAKESVRSGLDGKDPRHNLKDAAGELKRAGEKTIQQASDKADDLGN